MECRVVICFHLRAFIIIPRIKIKRHLSARFQDSVRVAIAGKLDQQKGRTCVIYFTYILFFSRKFSSETIKYYPGSVRDVMWMRFMPCFG